MYQEIHRFQTKCSAGVSHSAPVQATSVFFYRNYVLIQYLNLLSILLRTIIMNVVKYLNPGERWYGKKIVASLKYI